MTASPAADRAAAIPSALSPAQSVRVPVQARGERVLAADTDLVTVEEPLEIRLGYLENGRRSELNLAVTMRTPGDDFALALGFLFGEGVIQGGGDVADVAYCGPPSPDKGLRNTIKVELADHVRFDTERLLRHVFTSSSCGVCGKASLDAVRVRTPRFARCRLGIDEARLRRLPDALRAKQAEFERTGGLHGAAVFDAAGRIHRVREDIGRHNALDKLIGSFLRPGAVASETMSNEAPLEGLGVLLSGRASFELIQKAAMTHAPLVAAIGPPSSLAIELAADVGIALAGFLKPSGFNVYVAHDGRSGTSSSVL